MLTSACWVAPCDVGTLAHGCKLDATAPTLLSTFKVRGRQGGMG